MTQAQSPVQGICTEKAAQNPIPAEVQKLMDYWGWPEMTARRHVEQAASIRRAGYRPQFAGSQA